MRRHFGHADPTMTQKYAKLAPGAVADEVAEILVQLANEKGGVMAWPTHRDGDEMAYRG
jgi:hypothetical protein